MHEDTDTEVDAGVYYGVASELFNMTLALSGLWVLDLYCDIELVAILWGLI